MVARARRNNWGDCVYDEQSIIEHLYQNPTADISQLYIENTELYLTALAELDIDLPTIKGEPKHNETPEAFDLHLQSQWHMPANYSQIDVLKYLLDRCQTEQEQERVEAEYALFEKKNFTKVLQFLIYFVDTLRANNVVWGVGRGSSVASFCLFLIGVHKINPLLYNLDHREFLR
jgi:DNA polymerase III alpha subunit